MLGLDYIFIVCFSRIFLEMRRYIRITKPNLGNKASLLILSVYLECIDTVYKGVLNKL